ncbi:MAG: SecY-interacting protein Syd [Pseudomonadales bacterium]|nr:SecY-interacting protein Syd [Pseudomonadales bacterium]
MRVTHALTNFVDAYCRTYPVLDTAYDPEWTSPCEIGEPYSGSDGERRIHWRPIARESADGDFAPLERALETAVHPDIKAYYGAYWSGSLEAEAPDGHVSLLCLWNPDDIQRLTENLIGHVLAGRRARGPLSIFFACTEPDSEYFLSVENATGAVLLERPGSKPVRRVSDCLADFITTLVPALPPGTPLPRTVGGSTPNA